MTRLLQQRAGRAGFHARATRDAFGIDERLVRAGHDARAEAAALDRQRKGALHLVARAHATRADDAEGLIELEVGIALVELAMVMSFDPARP